MSQWLSGTVRLLRMERRGLLRGGGLDGHTHTHTDRRVSWSSNHPDDGTDQSLSRSSSFFFLFFFSPPFLSSSHLPLPAALRYLHIHASVVPDADPLLWRFLMAPTISHRYEKHAFAETDALKRFFPSIKEEKTVGFLLHNMRSMSHTAVQRRACPCCSRCSCYYRARMLLTQSKCVWRVGRTCIV